MRYLFGLFTLLLLSITLSAQVTVRTNCNASREKLQLRKNNVC